ncbi:hypothetical protein [Luteibacter yeojuensis]|nr:hypothetical protein [Luteibacter yeojuensis]
MSSRPRSKKRNRVREANRAPGINPSVVPTRASRLPARSTMTLMVWGALSFLGFAWLASIVYNVAPEAVSIGNSLPLEKWGWKGFLVFGLLAFFSIPMWIGWTFASRCQAVLAERLFK